LALDLGIADLRRAISEFADFASDADIAVVYYAGHGIEMDVLAGQLAITGVMSQAIGVLLEALGAEIGSSRIAISL
jgi:uncharacterized caspase-like protein